MGGLLWGEWAGRVGGASGQHEREGEERGLEVGGERSSPHVGGMKAWVRWEAATASKWAGHQVGRGEEA